MLHAGGGEEFIILLPNDDLQNGAKFAERLRRVVDDWHTPTIDITISIGISEYKQNDDIDSLIKRADEALYIAKDNGRNRVELG